MSKDQNLQLVETLTVNLANDIKHFFLGCAQSEEQLLSAWNIKKIKTQNVEKLFSPYSKIKVLSNGYKFRSY